MQANARMDVIDEDKAVIDRRCPALNCWSDLQVVHIPHQSGRWPPPTGCQRPPRWQHITLPNPQVQVSQHFFGAVVLGTTQPQVAGAK